MDATEIFNNILQRVQTSSLNFKIELSPFSASITLKKTLINDKTGNLVTPSTSYHGNHKKIKSETDDLVKKAVQQEVLIKSLKDNCEDAVNEFEKISKIKVSLENVNDALHSKLTAAEDAQEKSHLRIRELESELKEITFENHATKVALVKQYDISQSQSTERDKLGYEFKNLKEKNKNMKKIAEKKVKKMKKVKKIEKELERAREEIMNKHKKERSLSPSTSVNVSTSTASTSKAYIVSSSVPTASQMAAPSTCKSTSTTSPYRIPTVSTPAMSILALAPSSSSSTTLIEPMSSFCSHQPQCTTRQPRPPPLTKYSFLDHPHSDYRKHMINITVPSRYDTHEYCMRIDHHNYGCEDCVWWKWYGEPYWKIQEVLGMMMQNLVALP